MAKAKRKARAKTADSVRKSRFVVAVVLLVLIGLGISMYTNPSVQADWVTLGMQAAPGDIPEEFGYVSLYGGHRGTNIFSPNGVGGGEKLTFQWHNYPCYVRYFYEDSAGEFHEKYKGGLARLRLIDSKGKNKITQKWDYIGAVVARNVKPTSMVEWDLTEDIKGLEDGTYWLTVDCHQPAFAEREEFKNFVMFDEDKKEFVTGKAPEKSYPIFINLKAYDAKTKFVGDFCGPRNLGTKCQRKNRCIDDNNGVCEKRAARPALTPCNKGEWLQYDANPQHQGCTADRVYNTDNQRTPVLKWKNYVEGNNPAIVAKDGIKTFIYSANWKRIRAFEPDGTEVWESDYLLDGAVGFTGSPAIAYVRTPEITYEHTIRAPEEITYREGTADPDPGKKELVTFGGKLHKAIIAAAENGELVAVDAQTGEWICDKDKYGEQEICGWKKINVGRIKGSPVVFHGITDTRIYVATDTAIKMVTAEDGRVNWVYNIQNPTMPTISKKGGVVYFGTTGGFVYALQEVSQRFDITYNWEEKKGKDGKIRVELNVPEVGDQTVKCHANTPPDIANKVRTCGWKQGGKVRCEFGGIKKTTRQGLTTESVTGECRGILVQEFPATGVKPKWEKRGFGSLRVPPAYIEGPFLDHERDALVVTNSAGAVYRLNAENGNTIATTKDLREDLRPSTFQLRPPIEINGTGDVKYYFNVLAGAGPTGKMVYLAANMNEGWTDTLPEFGSEALVSESEPMPVLYFVDEDGVLSLYEVSPTGIGPIGGPHAPWEGLGKKTIFDVGKPASMPVISGNTLYVTADMYLYAFVVDNKRPTYSNVKQLLGDKEVTEIYTDETIRLCADWEDNIRLTEAKVVVRKGDITIYEKTKKLKGPEEKDVCFDYKPTKTGVYVWSMEATDVSGNINDPMPEKSFEAGTRPELDESAPEVRNPDKAAAKFYIDGATIPSKTIVADVLWGDDKELDRWGAWICTSDESDGCEPKTGKVGPRDPKDYEETWQAEPPADLKDEDAEWEAVPITYLGLIGTEDKAELRKFAPAGGWPQDKYVFWMVYSCDKANEYAAINKKWPGGTVTVEEGKTKRAGDYTVKLVDADPINPISTICKGATCKGLITMEIGKTETLEVGTEKVPATVHKVVEDKSITITIGEPAHERCNVYLPSASPEKIPRFYVRDVEDPKVGRLTQGEGPLEPDGVGTINLEADGIGDNVKVKEEDGIRFFIGEDVINFDPDEVVDGKAAVEYKKKYDPEDQGQDIDWYVEVEDEAGHVTRSEQTLTFQVADREDPKVEEEHLSDDSATVTEGELIKVFIKVTDNHELESVDLYVDGKSCERDTGGGEGGLTDTWKTHTLTCPAPLIVGEKRDFSWYIVVEDAFGNDITSEGGTFHVLPSCEFDSPFSPSISRAKESNTTILPGNLVNFTAEVSDDVDEITACGGVKNVWVEVQGEDELWYWAADAEITPTKTVSAVEEGEEDRIEEADVNASWNSPTFADRAHIPDYEHDFMVVRLSVENLGRLGALGGMGGLGESLGVTGLAASPPEKTYRPLGLPGTSFKWRFVAVDMLENQRESFGREIFVKDTLVPELVSVSQPENKLVYTEGMELQACWKDNGQIAKIIFESDELGKPINKSFDVMDEEVWAFRKLCQKLSFENPAVKPGTVVHWRVFAEDASGNQELAPMQEFRMVSEPPTIVEERTIPEKPFQAQPVRIEVDVTDDVGLQEAVLETNESGVFEEYARKDVGGTSATVRFEWTDPAVTPGTVVAWNVKVIDLDGNEVETHPEFVIQPDVTPPTVTDESQSSDSPPQGSVVLLSAQMSDNGGLGKAILETDEDGEFRNRTTKDLSGQSALVVFEWQNSDVEPGTTVKWRIYAIDASGNTAAGKQMSFTVTEAAIICPVCPPPTDWGRCTKGMQSRATYICDETTGFVCEAKLDTMACEMTVADLAFDAIQDAREAIATALAEGKDVTDAQVLLGEAELAYAGEDYLTAQSDALEAKKLAEEAAPPIAPIDITVVFGALLIVIIIAVVAVFAKKRAARAAAPAVKG